MGRPNAGKSTLLAAVSRAHPKIGDYPFTTVHPNLGAVYIGDRTGGDEFVLADLPGLIEGANEGAGLGTRFLGHVERTAGLIHLVDGTQEDVAGAYATVRQELEAYGAGLTDKPEIVALNKIDALDEATRTERAAELKAVCGTEPRLISGVSGQNVTEVLRAAWNQARERRAAEKAEAEGPAPEGWTP